MKKVKCIDPVSILKSNEIYQVISESKDFYWVAVPNDFDSKNVESGGWLKERFKIIEDSDPVCLD